MVTQPIDEVPEKTHDAVLLHLKRNGEMSVADLCNILGITSMAVRRHLSGLQKEGLVESRIVKKGRGRPSYKYRLTEKAETHFPSGFQGLAVDLLDAVFESQGAQGVMELLRIRNEKLIQRFSVRMKGKSIQEKVEEVARIFSESGYMTDWEALPDGNYFIYQRHCAVHNLAESYRQLCALEPKLIEALLGVEVRREKYMLNEDPVCGYLVETGK